MSSGSRVGGGVVSSIPANARKVVQDLKEIVKNSDDEIYSMLKECNMDPNETVQRLLSQDTFHEVKRKRDKKKENVIKESGEAWSRPSGAGTSMQGGRIPDHSNGRGGYVPRYNSEFNGGGRGQPFIGKDNGSYQNGRAPSVSTTFTAAVQPQAQIKTGSTGLSNTIVMTTSGLTGLPNGSSSYTRANQGNRGGWSIGPGQATMADIVKSSNSQQYAAASAPSPKGSTSQELASLSFNVSSGVYSSSIDPTLQSFTESHAMGPVGFKRDAGMVGNRRSMEEEAPVLSMEPSAVPDSFEQLPHNPEPSINRLDSLSSEVDVKVAEADMASTPVSSSHSQERTMGQAPTVDVGGSSEVPTISSSSRSPGLAGSRNSLISNQYSGRLVYQTQLQPLGSQKGSGLEWKPKSPVKNTSSSQAVIEASSVNEDARSSALTSPEDGTGMPLDSTTKLQQLNLQDDQPVIIPDHLQVPEADQSRLNFGSFGDDFDTPFSVNFASEEDNKSTASTEDSSPNPEAQAEEPIVSSLISSAPESFEQNYTSQSTASPVVASVGSEGAAISIPAPALLSVVSRPEVSKSEPVVQQGPGYPYLSAIPNYPGFGVMPQLMGSRYTYEPAESQPQDVSRLPSFVSPYSDPGQNYYSPVFRPSADVDARYAHFITTNAANKYNTGVALVTGQGLSSSQEGGNSVVIPASLPTGQTSQTVAQTGLTMQHHVPIHAYPAQHAGVPFTPFGGNFFGFQYVPPGYGYMPTPYQHNYAGNTGYPQAPSNGYAPAGASAYAPAGAATIKYSVPQYKPGTAPGNVQHAAAAAGYGSFTSPAGFPTVNSAITTATASGYDDVSGPQYKENNLYIPSQQAEGSTVWIQTQPSRDMNGMQTNSFYNMLGQGQHTGYAHTQPTHAVPAAAYANLYHQSQSGTAPAAHQLLQQPQALGAVGVGSAQSGAYQQPQRGQLSWANGY